MQLQVYSLTIVQSMAASLTEYTWIKMWMDVHTGMTQVHPLFNLCPKVVEQGIFSSKYALLEKKLLSLREGGVVCSRDVFTNNHHVHITDMLPWTSACSMCTKLLFHKNSTMLTKIFVP